MSIQKRLWNPSFVTWPMFPCPTCKVGHLRLIKDSQKHEETGPSAQTRDDPGWEPEWVRGRFIALLKCTHPGCREVVSVCGNHQPLETYSTDEAGEEQAMLFDQFAPKLFEPAPPIFHIPDKCPENAADEIRRAFSLYWADLASSANALRSAVEHIVDDFGIKKTGTNKRGDRYRLSLHKRIEVLGDDHPEPAKLLMAIKWIGNEGSHSSVDELMYNHLIDGFEFLEYAIDLLYVGSKEHLSKRAAAIVKRKGVLRKRKKAAHRPKSPKP